MSTNGVVKESTFKSIISPSPSQRNRKFVSTTTEVQDDGATEDEVKAELAAKERAVRAMSELAAKEKEAAKAASASSRTLRSRSRTRDRGQSQHVDNIDVSSRQPPSP